MMNSINIDKLKELDDALQDMAKFVWPADEIKLYIMQKGIWIDREDWEKQEQINYDLAAFQILLNGHNAINQGDGHIVILSNGNIQIDADFMAPDELQRITDIARTFVTGLYNNTENKRKKKGTK